MLLEFSSETYVVGRNFSVTEILPEPVKFKPALRDIKGIFITVTKFQWCYTVGARKRENAHGVQKAPPISGDCFWQIEKADEPLNGILNVLLYS